MSYLNWGPFRGWSNIAIPKESKYYDIVFWHPILSLQDVPFSIAAFSCAKKASQKEQKKYRAQAAQGMSFLIGLYLQRGVFQIQEGIKRLR